VDETGRQKDGEIWRLKKIEKPEQEVYEIFKKKLFVFDA